MKDSHSSADSTHYNDSAESYDILNEKNSRQINQVIEEILREHQVESVLDLTCGTGSQVFWLAKCGYKVTGSDINKAMLEIAKDKAKKDQLDVELLEGDMRSINPGTFDAVITILNAVGHLTRQDFELAIKNIRKNLNDGGLYIFDIFNLNYLFHSDNITALTIDWFKESEGKKIREIQYSTIDEKGILASYTTSIKQTGSDEPEIFESRQTLQIYSASQIKELLQRCDFEVIDQCGADGSKFVEHETERILTIARKQKRP